MGGWQIPLNIQTPNVGQTALNAYSQGAQLQMEKQAQAQNQQIRAEQLKQQQIASQEVERQQKEQATLRQAYHDSGGDLKQFRQLAVERGTSPKTLMAIDADLAKMQHQYNILDEDERKRQKDHAQVVGSAAYTMLQMKDADERARNLPLMRTQLIRDGYITNPADVPEIYPGDEKGLPWLKMLVAKARTAQQLAAGDLAQQNANTSKLNAEANQTRANTAASQQTLREFNQKLQDAAQVLSRASTAAEANALRDELPAKIADRLPKPPADEKTWDAEKWRRGVLNSVRTPDQQLRAEDTAEQRKAADQYRQDSLDLRRDIADQNAAIRREGMDLRRDAASQRRGPQLTPGQVKVEERNISALEYGTSARPGLHAQKISIGSQLKRGTDSKGQTLDDAGRQKLQADLEAVNLNLQQAQYRKAELYNIKAPNPQDVAAAQDGEEIQGADGSVWKKKEGVAYFVNRGSGEGSTPETKPPAPQAQTPQSKPIAKPSNGPGAPVKKVRMRAPNGQEQDVDPSQVEHYKSRGAVIVSR